LVIPFRHFSGKEQQLVLPPKALFSEGQQQNSSFNFYRSYQIVPRVCFVIKQSNTSHSDIWGERNFYCINFLVSASNILILDVTNA
jgi:hypothetical protein